MFAVLKTGGKQYRVAAEDEIEIEKIEAEDGATIRFDEILMIGAGETVTVGTPLVVGAAVEATVVGQTRGPHVVALWKRRRKHGSQRKRGHRQRLTLVKITRILGLDGAEATRAAAAPGSRPANLLTAAEGTPDDLTRIVGVGPGLQRKMNAVGVFHFRQIAAWGPDEIAWMNDKLTFKGRIQRDKWIAQATAFAAAAGNTE
jgi:large subunit ribosomal protein L21